MKKFAVGMLLFVALGMTGIVAAKHFWRGETMSSEKVGDRWGKISFDKEKFKNGDAKARSRMAYDLMRKKKLFVGKDRSEIRRELGDYDGFYFSDMYPTYLIERAESDNQDSWQLVFLLDRDEKVADIIVHKNCCD